MSAKREKRLRQMARNSCYYQSYYFQREYQRWRRSEPPFWKLIEWIRWRLSKPEKRW